LGFFVTFLKWLLYQEPIDPKESVPREWKPQVSSHPYTSTVLIMVLCGYLSHCLSEASCDEWTMVGLEGANQTVPMLSIIVFKMLLTLPHLFWSTSTMLIGVAALLYWLLAESLGSSPHGYRQLPPRMVGLF
jgi:hypothetical protein